WISTTSRWGSGYRSSLEPDRRSPYTGFRICRSLPGGPAAVPLNESWFAPYNQVPATFKNLTGTLTPLAKGIPDIAAWTKQRLILMTNGPQRSASWIASSPRLMCGMSGQITSRRSLVN
ncbi:MAG: hypothetical protein M3Z09_14380, partial [Acidobacteriota bacterium]|nr:hypothetical protein [Acidobacteriota bacterium]